MTHFKWYLDPLSSRIIKKKQQKQTNKQKENANVGPPLTQLSGSAHARAQGFGASPRFSDIVNFVLHFPKKRELTALP